MQQSVPGFFGPEYWYVCVYMCVCVCVSVSVYVHVHVSVCLCLFKGINNYSHENSV